MDKSSRIDSCVPIIKVSNLAVSVAYYCDALGFTKHGIYYPEDTNTATGYAYLSRNGHHIHVSSFAGDGVYGSAVYFRVTDIDSLHDEMKQAGAEILYDPDAQTEGPGNQPWGMREIYVKDPDGNVMRFGQRIE